MNLRSGFGQTSNIEWAGFEPNATNAAQRKQAGNFAIEPVRTNALKKPLNGDVNIRVHRAGLSNEMQLKLLDRLVETIPADKS